MSIVDRILGTDDADPQTPSDSEAFEASKDTLFHALKNTRRRFVLDVVGDLDEEDHVTLGTLAEELAYIENDDVHDIGQESSQQRKRVYICLYQTHLPNLHDWGLVEWDGARKTIRPTPGTRVAVDVIRSVDRELSGRGGWSA